MHKIELTSGAVAHGIELHYCQTSNTVVVAIAIDCPSYRDAEMQNVGKSNAR